ncbi:hypothetical protein F4821DRAFT_226663 [Hypoxylon rubiginosum]|uniref:Uncharacterized protein n=1 Tax=Hypoxylon rubiginosum TaxID=110542 RepID=A0ACC0DG57_9PEZI|nr:hypothetical protein F4821DRAFT_226663 [Hypoxylon rubiginosum]
MTCVNDSHNDATSSKADSDACREYSVAWDLESYKNQGQGLAYQPWRAHWPPQVLTAASEVEAKEQPWLTWSRNKAEINDKPWYFWVNDYTGEVDKPCEGRECIHCEGKGCNVCSTVAEGG